MFDVNAVDHTFSPQISYFENGPEVTGLPSLWDKPNPQTTEVAIFTLLNGDVLITSDEDALNYAKERIEELNFPQPADLRTRIDALVKASSPAAVLSDVVSILYEEGNLGKILDAVENRE